MAAYKKEVGQRLRAARVAAGETQATAAAKLSAMIADSVEPSRIGNYEQGSRLPDPITVDLLCQLYGAFPSVIYGFREAPSNREEEALLTKYRLTDDRGRRDIQSIAQSQPVITPEPGRITKAQRNQ